MVGNAAHDVIIVLVFVVCWRLALQLLASRRPWLLRSNLLSRHLLLQHLYLLQLLLVRLLRWLLLLDLS